MQAFYVLRKACCGALYRWHLLWQISVTTKGYAVNTRWQILKLACFYNCHFLRGERPFSGSLKTSGFQPAQHPHTCSHNHSLWKCHYSILKKLEQLCFFCNNYVFLNRGEKSWKPEVEKLAWIKHGLIVHKGKIKQKIQCQTLCQRWHPPSSVALFWSRTERNILLPIFK